MYSTSNTNNVYSSNIMDNVYSYETRKMQENYEAATDPRSGIIPNQGFQQQILNNSNGNFQNTNSQSYQYPSNLNTTQPQPQHQSQTFVSSLSGQEMSIENFTHNNMVPFFGGSIKQNMDLSANQNLLGKHTGTDQYYRNKTEVKNMGDITRNMANVNGSAAITSNQRVLSGFNPSITRNNELPFEQQRESYIIQGTERDAVLPKNVDQLRVASKPKASDLEGRLNPGSLSSGTRGKVGKVNKNRPDKFYRNSPDRYFKTGGAVKAAKLREKCYAKPTNRMQTRAHYGSAGPTEHTKPYKTGAYRKSRRNNYMNSTPRNASAQDRWMPNDENCEEGIGDYGKQSIENKPNERDITGTRTVINNITTEVKKLIAPVQDMFRMTRKENFVGNIRPEGNMKAAMPSKLTVYDADDVARTTIKETNIHNTHDGFLKGNEKITIHDPNDVARTTIKETNIHHKAPHINMSPQQPTSLRVYDPEDVPRTTMKETAIHNEHYGFVDGGDRNKTGGYLSTSVKMKETNRQFLSDYEYTGIANGDTETGGGRGYLAARYRAKNTHKQFLSNKEYKGHASSINDRPMSYSDKYNARLNPNKEKVARGRKPTQQGPKVTAGEDTINLQFKKLEADRINVREPTETFVYQAPPQKNVCGLTTIKEKLPEDTQRSRIEPDLLSAFNKNPYTQSLFSAV